MIRYDRGEIKEKHLTPEGFLKVDAIVTRTGVFKYRNADGSLRNELRPPEEVLKSDSLKSMELIPITLLHPKERVVDSTNARKLMRGAVGQKITHDGKNIRASIVVTDQEAIDAIQNGMQEVSLGYTVNLVQDEGLFEGERFDFKQTDIKYNHLAIVPRGRAGTAKVILDADDAEMYFDDLNEPKPQPKKEATKMAKISLDGIDYEAVPEVAREIDKLSKVKSDQASELEALKVKNSELTQKADAQEKELEELKKVDHSEVIANGVKARISLISKALKHLDGEESKDIEEKNDSEIKIAVIKKYTPDISLDEKPEAYIDALFDVALLNTPKNDEAERKLAEQRKKIKGDGNQEPKLDSKEKYKQDLVNAWKKQ